MDSFKQPEECQTHSLQCIAVSISPQGNEQIRYLCSKCLISDKRDVILLNDANQHFEERKQSYRHEKEAQCKKNLEVLKELSCNVMVLKNYYVSAIDKININIQQQVSLLDDEQKKLSDELQQLQLDSFLQSKYPQSLSNYEQIRILLQQQLKTLDTQDLLQQCYSTLQQIDNSEIEFRKNKLLKNQNFIDSKRTPSLPLTCSTHEKEIIFFDLSEERTKDNRLACVYCITGKEGSFVDLSNVQKQWDAYENERKQLITCQQDKTRKIIETVQQSFQLFQRQIANKIQDINEKLISKFEDLYKNSQLEISKMERNWNTFVKEEVLLIADVLSTPQHTDILQKKSKQEFEDLDHQLNEIIKDSLLYFREQEQYCREQLKQIVKLDSKQLKKQIIEVETQTDCVNHINQDTQINYELKDNQTQFDNFVKLKIEKNVLIYQSINTKKQLIIKNNIDNVEPIMLKPANYQIQNNYSVTQNEYSYALAMNKDSNILIAGCDKQIKVFEFQNGQLTQKQLLTDHTGTVCSLYFMKKVNQFISGSQEGQMRIWSLNNSYQWYCQYLLKDGHTGWMMKIIMTFLEDIMISCSNDKNIKFWKLELNEWKCFQTLSIHTGCVRGISLNESQTKLVSCGEDNQIIISEQGIDKQWKAIQNIKVDQFGYRICFIGDNFITFQSNNAIKMDIFEFNQQSKQFVKSKEVKNEKSDGCHCWFPQIYNQKKQLIVNKNGQYVYLIRIKNKSDFIVEQTIKCGHYNVYGTLTDDGEYLITWDQASKQFQIRKQQS